MIPSNNLTRYGLIYPSDHKRPKSDIIPIPFDSNQDAWSWRGCHSRGCHTCPCPRCCRRPCWCWGRARPGGPHDLAKIKCLSGLDDATSKSKDWLMRGNDIQHDRFIGNMTKKHFFCSRRTGARNVRSCTSWQLPSDEGLCSRRSMAEPFSLDAFFVFLDMWFNSFCQTVVLLVQVRALQINGIKIKQTMCCFLSDIDLNHADSHEAW